MTRRDQIHSIDAYIERFPPRVRTILESVRKAIASEAPLASETIKYGIPTFVYRGNLVHFGAYVSHIGFYPTPNAIRAFADELSGYKTSRGAIQFPLDQPMPLSLIRKIVAYRVRNEG